MNDEQLVRALYTKVLTHGGSLAGDASERRRDSEAEKLLADDWVSIGTYDGAKKDRTAFLKQVGGFMELIPDLAWRIEEVIASGDRYVVRSRATGTPRGAFFGVPPSGKKFDIMTIDIHTVRDGRIAQTYHVEDWATALGQLR